MSPALEPVRTDEVYRADLEPRPRGRVTRTVLGALDLWCAQVGGGLELTQACDVVVRRRSDRVEEVRLPVPDPDQAALFLHQVRGELLALDPAAFRAAWGIA